MTPGLETRRYPAYDSIHGPAPQLAAESPQQEGIIVVKISTTEDTCVAAGQCVRSAPNVFAQRVDDGKVELLKESPPDAEHDLVREAADFCPSASIHIQE